MTEQAKVLEVFQQSDIPEATREALNDSRVQAIAARGCFNEIPKEHNGRKERRAVVEDWINGLDFTEGMEEVIGDWTAANYPWSIAWANDLWVYHSTQFSVQTPHLDAQVYDTLKERKMVVGPITLIACWQGSGRISAERQPYGRLAKLLGRPPLTVPNALRWDFMQGRVDEDMEFSTVIEHDTGDGILLPAYPLRVVHRGQAVDKKQAVDEPAEGENLDGPKPISVPTRRKIDVIEWGLRLRRPRFG
jgi:hypothetical protein